MGIASLCASTSGAPAVNAATSTGTTSPPAPGASTCGLAVHSSVTGRVTNRDTYSVDPSADIVMPRGFGPTSVVPL